MRIMILEGRRIVPSVPILGTMSLSAESTQSTALRSAKSVESAITSQTSAGKPSFSLLTQVKAQPGN